MINEFIDIWELLLLPIYISVVIGVAAIFSPKTDRKIYYWSFLGRLGGALFFASIYLFYYGGGDTLAYYKTAIPFVNQILDAPRIGIPLWLSDFSRENLSLFTNETGYPLAYIYSDSRTFTVSQLIVPFLILSFKSYLLATVLISAFTFIGVWKLHTTFKEIINDKWIAAISALFVPSVLFWGAGISKDTITFTSTAYFIYGFYFTVIKKKINPVRILFSVISVVLIITIKPYIFLVLLPGVLLWLLSNPISRIKNRFVRRSALPFIASISAIIFFYLFGQFGELLGSYSADQIIEKALVTQDDLKRDYYGGNTFDIGEVDPSFTGILSKVPISIFFGLYGPTLIHVNNIVMLFSALENTLLLLLTLRIAIQLKFGKLIKVTLDQPVFLFSIIFTLLFAFAIGFTTPNFGAMVRFKIPLVPFFVFYLLGVYKTLKQG